MELLSSLLHHPVGLLFTIVALGVALGQIPFGPVRLGGSGVLLAGLVFGHYGYQLPAEIQTIGVVLFVYTLGLRAGPYFVTAIRKSRGSFFFLALVIILSAGGLAFLFKNWFSIPASMSAGIFAGAMTSTPALAAAMETAPDSLASVGFGLAYPLGILGVILMVQLLPVLFKINLAQEDRRGREEMNTSQITRRCFRVTNENLTRASLAENPVFAGEKFRIVRIKRGQEILTPHADEALKLQDLVLVVGPATDMETMKVLIGEEVALEIPESDAARSRWILISSRQFSGRRIGNLEISHLYGVILTRVRRSGIEFVPHSNFVLEAGDEVRISGIPADLARFESLTGRDRESLEETDIFSFAAGLALGVLLGLVRIPVLPELSLSFGIAGGPLIIGLLLGYFGRFGHLTARMPKAAKFVVGELGLFLFLAAAGCAAGEHFLAVLQNEGWRFILCGFLITVFPVWMAALTGHFLFRMNLLLLLGMITGGMTSTPALGVLTSGTRSDIPALGYTAIYPLAVLLTTLAAQLLVLF